MTETITTPEDTTTPAQPVGGELQHVDPNSLIVGDNVRDDAALDRDFVNSITTHGVLLPITAVRDDANQLIVRDGQRRCRAAQSAGLSSVPVYVLPSDASNFKEFTVERLVQQISLNDQRTDLTEAQRAKGIQQILDAGVSVTKAAKLLSAPKKVVQSAQAAGRSAAAMDALSSGQIGLDEAAIIAEFGDDEQAVTTLLNVAGTGRFDHTVERLRREKELEAAYAQAEAEYVANGITVIDETPHWADLTCVGLRYLRTAEGTDLTDEAATALAAADPSHWVAFLTEADGYFDPDTGTEVDEDLIDFDTRWDEAAEPEDGLRHYNSVEERTIIVPEWFCTNYQAAGLTLAPALAGVAERAANAVDAEHQGEAVAMPDAEAKAEAEKRERRKVIALNRLGDATITVRRAWVKTLLTRKTAPKGAASFVAGALVQEPTLIGDYRTATLAAELLGLPTDKTDGRGAIEKHLSGLGTNSDNRAQVVTLALVLAALEGRTPKDAWRGGGAHPYRSGVSSAQYIAFLQANGYEASEVEAVILGTSSSDDLYEAVLESAKATTKEAGEAEE